MVTLNKINTNNLILPRDMKDGQIAEIIGGEYNGKIIQRVDRIFTGNIEYIPIGQTGGNIFTQLHRSVEGFVRVLKDGETLTIINNQ